MTELAQIAVALVSDGKGILAADETVSTLTKRFDALKIASTPSNRRDYRELLLTTPGAGDFISGVILHDETIRQQGVSGAPLVSISEKLGILPGIKVDAGAKPLAGRAGEHVTEGLDGLRDRLMEYRQPRGALCQVASGFRSERRAAEQRVHPGELRCARALRGALPRAALGANRRARGVDGRRAQHRTL